MQRLTISIDDELAETFEKLIKDKGYENRSEAFRDLLRGALVNDSVVQGSARYCVGVLSYVYNHHERQLASRLTEMQHDHHDVTVSTMHAHLDHENCIEAVILRGATRDVTHFAESVVAQTGVRHGKFNIVPVDAEDAGHKHHHHVHAKPRS
ncbi:MAG: nickel-responsive transcriptional regulator NikR [Gammaproteobacteria bacterium]